jgi:hypothetical protein
MVEPSFLSRHANLLNRMLSERSGDAKRRLDRNPEISTREFNAACTAWVSWRNPQP